MNSALRIAADSRRGIRQGAAGASQVPNQRSVQYAQFQIYWPSSLRKTVSASSLN